MAENKLTYEFVMSDWTNRQYLYVHEHQKLYTFAADRKKPIPGKTYRCTEHTKGCKSRVFISSETNQCMVADKWQPHIHNDNCEQRFKELKAKQEVKTEISSVQNVASGSRMKRPREVYKTAIVK